MEGGFSFTLERNRNRQDILVEHGHLVVAINPDILMDSHLGFCASSSMKATAREIWVAVPSLDDSEALSCYVKIDFLNIRTAVRRQQTHLVLEKCYQCYLNNDLPS